jgi:hypothetical protein
MIWGVFEPGDESAAIGQEFGIDAAGGIASVNVHGLSKAESAVIGHDGVKIHDRSDEIYSVAKLPIHVEKCPY